MMNGYSYHSPAAAAAGNYSFAAAHTAGQPAGTHHHHPHHHHHLTQLGSATTGSKHSPLSLNSAGSLAQPLQQPFHQQFAPHAHFSPLDEPTLGAQAAAAAAVSNHSHITSFSNMDYFSKSAMINSLSMDSFIAAGQATNGKLVKQIEIKSKFSSSKSFLTSI